MEEGSEKVLATLVVRIDEVVIPALKRIEGKQAEQDATDKRHEKEITQMQAEFEDIRVFKRAFIGQVVGIVLTAILAILALANSLP